MPVDATPEDIKKLLDDDPGGPVVMLNLMRYKPDGGRERYAEYAAKAQPYVEGVGGKLIYAGECSNVLVSPQGFEWDSILVVFYPSRQAFFEMVSNPDYFALTHIRTEALEEAVLQATSPWEGAPT